MIHLLARASEAGPPLSDIVRDSANRASRYETLTLFGIPIFVWIGIIALVFYLWIEWQIRRGRR